MRLNHFFYNWKNVALYEVQFQIIVINGNGHIINCIDITNAFLISGTFTNCRSLNGDTSKNNAYGDAILS